MSLLRSLVSDLMEVSPQSPEKVLNQLKKIVNGTATRGYAAHIRAECAKVLKYHAEDPVTFRTSYPILLGEIDIFLYGVGSDLTQTSRNIEKVCNTFPEWCRAAGCNVSDDKWPLMESIKEFENHAGEFMAELTPIGVADVASRMVRSAYYPKESPTLSGGMRVVSSQATVSSSTVEPAPGAKARPSREWALYALGTVAVLSSVVFILFDCGKAYSPGGAQKGDALLLAVRHCLLVAFAVAVVGVLPLRLYIHRQKRASRMLHEAANPIG